MGVIGWIVSEAARAARSSSEQLGAARSSSEQLGAARSSSQQLVRQDALRTRAHAARRADSDRRVYNYR